MEDFSNNARWINPPVRSESRADGLWVEAARGSDFWRETHYGFTRESGHALVVPLSAAGALNLTLRVDFAQLYDQAGIFLRNSNEEWLKAGIEVTDGAPHVGTVVTRGQSDWSLAPVPQWKGSDVNIRASWSNGAVTLRARPGTDERWQTIRVAPFPVDASTEGGLYICSPERAGLVVHFSDVFLGPADEGLHMQPPL